MRYKIIFDITQTKFQHWSDLAAGFVFIIFAIGMFWFHWRRNQHIGSRSFSYFVLLGLFLTIWSLLPFFMFFDSYRNYSDIKTALRQSNCKIVEGVVTQFHQISESRNPGNIEAFVVNGVGFRYREGSAQNGFHKLGIVREGMNVRINYYDKNDSVDNDIARLEIVQ